MGEAGKRIIDVSGVAKALRKLGDDTAREYAVNAGDPLDEVRRCSPAIISGEWKDLITKGVVPKGILMREFKIGWRDSTMSVCHGKPSGYNQGCRCKLCKRAISDYHKDRQQRKRMEAAVLFAEKYNKGSEEALARMGR